MTETTTVPQSEEEEIVINGPRRLKIKSNGSNCFSDDEIKRLIQENEIKQLFSLFSARVPAENIVKTALGSGITSALSNLLSKNTSLTDEILLEQITLILANLSGCSSEGSKAVLTCSTLVPTLFSILCGTKNRKIQQNVALILGNVAFENGKEIRETGCFYPLVDLFKTDNSNSVKCGLFALTMLIRDLAGGEQGNADLQLMLSQLRNKDQSISSQALMCFNFLLAQADV